VEGGFGIRRQEADAAFLTVSGSSFLKETVDVARDRCP